MAYTAVHVFGDSLVDAGNALELAQAFASLPFTALPEGAPTAQNGYFDGRFSNGYSFADLIANKYIGVPSRPVFPFGYEDPFFGISFPFASDPHGNNLNWAYGGAKIIRGGEAVPDLDGQTDAYRDAVDGAADPNALHLITIGGNDVRTLVPASGAIASEAAAMTKLQAAADALALELEQLIEIGAQHFVLTNIPNVGIIPFYNSLPDEAARRAAATQFSDLFNGLIQQQIDLLRASYPSIDIRYLSFDDALENFLPNLQALYGADAIYPLNQNELLFVDEVHPSAQAHALLAASFLDSLAAAGPAGEILPQANPTMTLHGSIDASAEVDAFTLSLVGGHTYTFALRGESSGAGTLADPILTIASLSGTVLAQNDDAGLGLDAHLAFTPAASVDFRLSLGAVGSVTGSYALDVMTGDSAGDSTYIVADASRMIVEGTGQGFDRVLASVSYALNSGAAVELLATTNDAGTAAINLTGNEFTQQVIGNQGANILADGGGADTLIGLGGNDTYIIQSLLPTIVEAVGGGTDTVETSISLSLGANLENLTLKGVAAINGTGNGLVNTITGNASANVLNGGIGADTLIGGLGNDTYVVDNAGDKIVEVSNGGTDLVLASVSFTIESNVENLTLTGTAAINATGNSGRNVLIGNSANNILDGMTDADTMAGGLGNDIYNVNTGGDTVIEGANEGTDLVQSLISYTLGPNVENLTLIGSSSINGTGNAANNVIIGNAAANTLNGGAGADRMDGGPGNDTYVVDDAGDLASETSGGGGTDTVKSSVSHTLGANIENLTLTGAASVHATGNALGNTILGNNGANTLLGLAGDDTLRGDDGADKLFGGLGNDSLRGGDGADVYVFDTLPGAGNIDSLVEYSVSADTIWLSKSIFAAINTLGTLSAAAFRTGTAALDGDDRIVYDKANGDIYYDADGNGSAVAIQFAHVSAGLSLTYADFFVI